METLNDKPVFPLLEIYNNDYFLLITNEEELSRARVSNFYDQDQEKSCCFDAKGYKWRYILKPLSYKPTALKKILAHIVFFNPFIAVIPEFRQTGNYELSLLKQLLKKCVDTDTDIITQFVEGDVIKTAIDEATNFKEILAVFEKYIFDVDEEQMCIDQEEKDMPE